MRSNKTFSYWLFALSFLAFTLASNAQTGVQSRMDLKTKKKTKSSTIKYKWHKGKATLKTDLPLVGTFKYNPVKNDVPHWIYISDKPNAEKKYIDITLFRELTLEGAEPYITDRNDSTYYKWVDEYDNLMRRVKQGEIELYDNSKVINEKYSYIDDYYLVGIRENYGQRKLNRVKDLKVLMNDRPYFIESAELSGRIESRDLRVVAYLVDLYNDKNPMEFLKWETVEFSTTKGDKVRAKGYVQPVDLRNEYETSSKALLHIWRNGEFEIFESKTIKNLKVGGKPYREGYFGLTDKTFLGKKWTYSGRTFLVANRILNNNSYYFIPRVGEAGQSLIILEKKASSYVKPSDEMELRKIFTQLNNL